MIVESIVYEIVEGYTNETLAFAVTKRLALGHALVGGAFAFWPESGQKKYGQAMTYTKKQEIADE